MAPSTVNVLLTSFPGLKLPSTLSLPLSSDCTIEDLGQSLQHRLPPNAHNHRLILTTSSNTAINLSSPQALASLLSSEHANILPLRLSVPLCGGKGGFGSQLRAAGGRMSSRKKRAGQYTNGSNRNLDGRRLRTVTEAKALAEYLAVKPEMAKREKEERRKRLEAVINAAERKEEELRDGKKNARVDGKWLEGKEEAETKTRDAVLKALKAGQVEGVGINLSADNEESSSPQGSSSSGSEAEDNGGQKSSTRASASSNSDSNRPAANVQKTRSFFGWDDEDDLNSDSEDEPEENAPPIAYTGKGKGRA